MDVYLLIWKQEAQYLIGETVCIVEIVTCDKSLAQTSIVSIQSSDKIKQEHPIKPPTYWS